MDPHVQNRGGAGEELRSDAKHLGTAAANRLHGEVDARKGTAATQAKSASSAIERAAGELGDDTPPWLKSMFTKGAEQVQRFADTLEQKDSRQLLGEVNNFARQHPGTFLAGCAAAGFAAARVLKAGEADSDNASTARGWDQRSEFQSDPTAMVAPLPEGELA